MFAREEKKSEKGQTEIQSELTWPFHSADPKVSITKTYNTSGSLMLETSDTVGHQIYPYSSSLGILHLFIHFNLKEASILIQTNTPAAEELVM